MTLPTSNAYAQLVDKACWSHAHGRSVFHITQTDVDAARLFSYGYRSHTIGTFHATRVAIERELQGSADRAQPSLCQATALLGQLEAKAVEPVPRDFRCVISTFYFYDKWVKDVADTLAHAGTCGGSPNLGAIRSRYLGNLQSLISGDGIYMARDVSFPDQGTFIVPNLGISIVPVIYGDYHSWNAAFLRADQPGVALHRHRKGTEIHLGFSPVRGETILGSCFAGVSEGYAMPIPPMTDHGFLNTSGHDHIVPFIFGSLVLSGWGVFFDVEPRPSAAREEHALDSPAMNYSVFLERAIRQSSAKADGGREVLIPAERAGSKEIGGLELAVGRIGTDAVRLTSDHYRIVAVQSGRGCICMGNVGAELTEHDHVGIPAEMNCTVAQVGSDPLVLLDAMILPIG